MQKCKYKFNTKHIILTRKRFFKIFLYKKSNPKKYSENDKGVTQNKNYGKINFKKYTKKVHFSESTKYTMVNHQ